MTGEANPILVVATFIVIAVAGYLILSAFIKEQKKK